MVLSKRGLLVMGALAGVLALSLVALSPSLRSEPLVAGPGFEKVDLTIEGMT